jgi:hypothetical protein
MRRRIHVSYKGMLEGGDNHACVYVLFWGG